MCEVKCQFATDFHPCPYEEVIEAGVPRGKSGKFWCGNRDQEAKCGNEVHAVQTRSISHRAAHGRNVHKVDMPRSTSTGSIETAQSAENYLLFQETQEKQRQVIQKHGYDIS